MSFVLHLRDFYAANRGGGLFSEAVSQRLGAVLAYHCARLGLKPTVVTLIGLTVGLLASGSVFLGVSGWFALLGWQLAYAFDCADGQLARVTGRAGSAGARVDVLADVVSHIAIVGALVWVAQPPLWLATLLMGTWMVNLITSVLAGSPMITSTVWPVRLAKSVRDHGAIILIAGLLLALYPAGLIWFVSFYAALNTAFLLLSLAHAARTAPGTHPLTTPKLNAGSGKSLYRGREWHQVPRTCRDADRR